MQWFSLVLWVVRAPCCRQDRYKGKTRVGGRQAAVIFSFIDGERCFASKFEKVAQDKISSNSIMGTKRSV